MNPHLCGFFIGGDLVVGHNSDACSSVWGNPVPTHQYVVSTEKSALSKHFTKRNVLSKNKKQLLLASWNVANLGVQSRTPEAKALIAHILKRFDLIALQELNDRYEIIDELLNLMGRGFDYIMTDTAGNQERLAYIYRKRHVTPTNPAGTNLKTAATWIGIRYRHQSLFVTAKAQAVLADF